MGTTLCPRCRVHHFSPYGDSRTAEDAAPPALSRAADVHVCSMCGIHEGFMALAGIPLPMPDEWPVELPEIEQVAELS